MTSLASVDWDALLEVIWTSMAAGLALVIAASLGILAVTRAATHRRDGRHPAATAYAGLAFIAGLACSVGVVLAVTVMLQKG